MANSGNIKFGPGRIRIASLGSAEPTDLTTDLPSAVWGDWFYTLEGSEFSYELTTEEFTPAEEFDATHRITTARAGTFSFVFAEDTVQTAVHAFNGATVTVTGTGASEVIAVEPPAPGDETYRMIVWESEKKDRRLVLRKVFQTGSVSMAHRKGAEARALAVEYAVLAPGDSKAPWKRLYPGSARGGYTA